MQGRARGLHPPDPDQQAGGKSVCRVTRLPPYNGAKCSTSSQSKHPPSLYPHALKHSTQILLLHTADVETGKKTPPLTALGKEAGFQFDWVICLRRPSSVFCVH